MTEFHTWDPHKAAKDHRSGRLLFQAQELSCRRRAAIARRCVYKDNDAMATIRLAVCLEKLGGPTKPRAEYESYLKILPHGPQAEEAQKAIDRLKKAQRPERNNSSRDRVTPMYGLSLQSLQIFVWRSGLASQYERLDCPHLRRGLPCPRAASPRIRLAGHFGPECALPFDRTAWMIASMHRGRSAPSGCAARLQPAPDHQHRGSVHQRPQREHEPRVLAGSATHAPRQPGA